MMVRLLPIQQLFKLSDE
ncbi:hypothetical protein EJB06_30925 [Massilia atriviolacea]|uniref:Uncharacterized protein n=1 Tax=Massilia atriviolacea TaxID=2495579 RepID=A0A430HC98_9BURK|nr:hypothetical protein EJB06_30925 [Massilia atriviolacea]